MEAALGLLLLIASVLHAPVHHYNAANEGYYINLPGGHWCGVEVRGVPGAFCDVD